MGSYGKSFRGLIISSIREKFSGGGVAENYGTVGKFHKNINFSLKLYLTVYLGKLFWNKRQKTRIKRKWKPYFRSADDNTIVVISSGESTIGSRMISLIERNGFYNDIYD